MADVDDEFLALVGGDESDDEVSAHSRAGSEAPGSDGEAQSTSKSRRRKHNDSDEEEGEASDVASVASQESAPMDESDSDNEGPSASHLNGKMGSNDDDSTAYPVDGIYVSIAEKHKILAMPELEREQLLAKRQEDVDRQRQNTLLRALLKNREDDSQSAKKRKAGSEEPEESARKTSRQRTKVGGAKVGETSSGIESLRRARAEKNDRIRRREEDRERNKDRSTAFSRGDSEDRDGDSDVDWDNGNRRRDSASRTPEVKEIPVAELRDIERVRLGRIRFAQVCFFPGFEAAITGCYVRISIGPDRDGVPVYRMAVIKGFTQGKPYAVEKENGQTFVTDQYLRAAHGKAEREWPFIMCSESPFTESEFNRYKAVCQDEGVFFPKKPTLMSKADDINKLINRTWTDVEINEKIERQKALRDKYAPDERNRVTKALEDAKKRGDHAKVSELESKLDTIETPRLALGTSLTAKKTSSSTISQQDRLAQLNIENRRKNAEKVRKAQVADRARDVEARMSRAEALAAQASQTDSGTTKPANGTSTTTNGGLPHLARLRLQNQESEKEKKGIPQIHKPLVDDDIIAAIDLDIDVEID